MKKGKSLYHGHRFPGVVISCAVRWYFRLSRSFRDVGELLLERSWWSNTRRSTQKDFLSLNEYDRSGDEAPTQPDPSDPPPRAKTFGRKVRGHSKDEVREEEDAGPGPESGRGPVDIPVRGERGETDVDPIEPGRDETCKQQRHESTIEFAQRRLG
jgi:hypothetical protein